MVLKKSLVLIFLRLRLKQIYIIDFLFKIRFCFFFRHYNTVTVNKRFEKVRKKQHFEHIYISHCFTVDIFYEHRNYVLIGCDNC